MKLAHMGECDGRIPLFRLIWERRSYYGGFDDTVQNWRMWSSVTQELPYLD